MTPRWKASFLASAMLLALTSAVVQSTSAGAAEAAWTTTFRDDFSGTGPPDPASWLLTLGTQYPGGPGQFGTGEVETNTDNPANVSRHDGNLYITPLRDASGNWTSARIETTRSDFKAPPGGQMRAEARIRMPDVAGAEALGYWPAFWMLGSPYRADRWSWPGIGEFDIMENIQGQNKNWATLHCGVWGGPCNEPEGISSGGVACPGASCQSDFHLYSFVWDRSGAQEQMRWYTDNQLTHTVNQSQVPPDTWTQMTQHAGYFLILNVAMGGAFPNKDGGGPTPATRSGVPMIVDYVQVATLAGSGTPTTSISPTTTTSTISTIPTTPTSATTPTTQTPPTTTTTPTTQTTPTTPTTDQPSDLHVAGMTDTTITLEWSGSASGRYDILRSGIRIDTVTGTRFTDIGLGRDTPYIYSVRGAGVTTPEITVRITEPTTIPPSTSTTSTTTTPSSAVPPAGPRDLRVAASTPKSITLSWVGSSTSSYDILRAGVRIATVTGPGFTDTGLFPNTPYIYSVRGDGVTTPEITATIH